MTYLLALFGLMRCARCRRIVSTRLCVDCVSVMDESAWLRGEGDEG